MLDNLIENAPSYSPDGGAVAIEFGRDTDEAFLAGIDEGPGLAEGGKGRRALQRFARGSASKGGPGGTGLGLAIVETLAERWGGRASLGTRPEGGARAEVHLPAGTLPTLNPELDEALTAPH